MMQFLQPMGEQIIQSLSVKDGDLVLDIAAGTGEPGLTIASMIPHGEVIITDLAEGMLVVAEENARKRGITNVETKACDVCELPFADNTFDAISCHFGFMFFPDMQLAVNEMVRVLKPRGKLATTVWNVPEKISGSLPLLLSSTETCNCLRLLQELRVCSGALKAD